MNSIGYTITALIVLACCYLLLVPRWGRRKPEKQRWGRGSGYQPTGGHGVPLNPPSGGSAGTPAPPRRVIIEDRRSPRPQSAERMRSVRHETRKPRAPVRAVPEPRTPTYPLRTREEDAGLDISTLLTIGMLSDGSHYASISPPADSSPDCTPSDSGGGCDGGGGGGD